MLRRKLKSYSNYFTLKFYRELVRFSAMPWVHLYAPLASKLHFVPCLNFLCEIARGVEVVEKDFF